MAAVRRIIATPKLPVNLKKNSMIKNNGFVKK